MGQNKRLLMLIAGLQILVLLMLVGINSIAPARAAGIPDAGAQRDQMIEQQKATNDKLDKILDLLSRGELHVKVTKADANGEGH